MLLEFAGDRLGVLAGVCSYHRFAESRAVAGATGVAKISVDPAILDTEFPELIFLGSEVLSVGGAAGVANKHNVPKITVSSHNRALRTSWCNLFAQCRTARDFPAATSI